MDIAYLAAFISAAIIKIAALILCAIVSIGLLLWIKELLDSKGLLSLLKTVGTIFIILSIISLPLIILSITTPSPLIVGIVGGAVGAIFVAPLIAVYGIIFTIVHIDYQHDDDVRFWFSTSTLLFIGNIVAGACLATSGVFPICKIDSLLSLSTTLESLFMVGIHALALTIVSAIVVIITVELIKKAKEYISDKIWQPKEESVEPGEAYSVNPSAKIDATEEAEKGHGNVPEVA